MEPVLAHDPGGSTLTAPTVRPLSAVPDSGVLVQLSTAWMARAACKGQVDLFFGIAGERPERRARREAAARQVCAGCPVLEPCREAARLNRESGFWGGENEEERAAAGFAPRSVSRRSVQAAATRGNVTRQASDTHRTRTAS